MGQAVSQQILQLIQLLRVRQLLEQATIFSLSKYKEIFLLLAA